jgi:hypothetical protein
MSIDYRTGEITEPLTAMERSALVHEEAAIEQGAEKVAKALAAIRDRRLYREDYSTFEDYCRERWGMTHRHVNREIVAAEVAEALGPMGPVPERQARELADLRQDPDALRDAYQKAHEATEGKVTAAAIREARGRQAPTPPTDGQRLADAVAEFPDLAHYAETNRAVDALQMAADLRRYRERGELGERLSTLRRSIEIDKAKRDGTYQPTPPTTPPQEQAHVCPTCGQTVRSNP